jgi:crotonobetainyl-CoA:carnitine CoA-transferase CaiB-like acyl-CoA transferase
MRSSTARPLSCVTVLDFSRVLAGPYCTRLLADLGARVVKVERPGAGDETREAPDRLDPARRDQSTYFVRLNAGKWSLALDLGHPRARAVVEDLARVSDVLVENFRPGVMQRLGLDYARLCEVRADLVYCSISGYGQTGPLRDWPAFAHTVAAMSGVTDLERNRDPAPRVGYLQTADLLAGTHAFGAILAALFQRERSGRGAFIDVSMLECLVAAEDVAFGSLLNGGAGYTGPRPGMFIVPFPDGAVALQVAGGAQFWPRLADLLGHPELATDPRFATREARTRNHIELETIVREGLARFPVREAALAALRTARVPCAPILTPEEVVTHPHLLARGAFPAVDHPTRGSVRLTATPFRFSDAALGPAAGAPFRPGEDSERVLRELLGYPAERVAELTRTGVVVAAS